MGRTLVVDSVYGSDVSGAASRYSYPFATINGAISNVSSGETIFVRPGTYTETIAMPAGVALRGANTQTVTITRTNVTSNVTLLTMGSNCRVEDVTFTLTSLCNVNLTGVDWPSGTPLTAKLRTLVVNVTSSGTGSNTIVGMLSSGSSATTYSASDATRSITVNVDASSSGPIRGLYLTGSNWFGMRDTNINARGTGGNIVGVETTNAGSYASLKHCTVRGGDASTNHYDINRAAGTILLGSTDMINNNANGNSFTPAQAPASFTWGVLGNMSTNRRYYLVPGTVTVGNLTNEPVSNTYAGSNALPVPFVQPSSVIDTTMTFLGTIPSDCTLTMKLIKNRTTPPVLSLTMTSTDGGLKRNTTQSASFGAADTVDAILDVSGNPGTGSFIGVIGYY
jgi:hypothetical protein